MDESRAFSSSVLAERSARHTRELDDHEARIRALERAQWRIGGAVVVAVFVAQLTAKYFIG